MPLYLQLYARSSPVLFLNGDKVISDFQRRSAQSIQYLSLSIKVSSRASFILEFIFFW